MFELAFHLEISTWN